MGYGSAVSYQNSNQLLESTNRSKLTYQIIENLMQIYSTMTVAESGRRGYVFLNDTKELYRFQGAVRDLDPILENLRRQFGTRLDQLKRLAELEALLDSRIGLMRQSIDLYRVDQTVNARQQQITEESVQLRDQIQRVLASLQTTEEISLEEWVRQSQERIHRSAIQSFLIVMTSFVLLTLALVLLYQQRLQRQAAEAMQASLAQAKVLGEDKLRFFSMVSHEFRTPLSVILGSVQLLIEADRQWSLERKQKNLSRIQSSAKLMTRLLTDILTLTRAEAGKLECNPEPLDVEAFCLNLVDEIELATQSQHPIEFISQGQSSLPKLDEKLLYSILSNLLANAAKYSPSGQPILLTLSTHPDCIEFQVMDQGIGIAPEEQANIYQLFYRGKNTGAIAGTGLGLTIVQKCVELHHGEIFLESSVDKGSIFTVRLPIRV